MYLLHLSSSLLKMSTHKPKETGGFCSKVEGACTNFFGGGGLGRFGQLAGESHKKKSSDFRSAEVDIFGIINFITPRKEQVP